MYLINLILGAILLQTTCLGLHEMYKGQQVWQVDAPSAEEAKRLSDVLLYSMEGHKSLPNGAYRVTFRVDPADFGKVEASLRSSGLSRRVIVEDVQKQLTREDFRNRRHRKKRSVNGIKDFVYSEYHSLDEIEQWMDLLAAEYSFIKKIRIGTSLEGRELHGLHVATTPGKHKPIFYMDAATHAREWIAPATLMFVLKEILTNSAYARLLDELDFYLFPVVNLDGYEYTWSDARLWRKTRRPYAGNSANALCVGVDANRNWNISFGGEGASHDPCSILYHGPYAESEPVIHHLANFIKKKRDKIKAVVSFHNYGQQILYPYNYNLTLAAKTEDELNSTGTRMSAAMEKIHGSKYQCGRGSIVLYVFSGSTSDWAYEQGIGFSYTLELRDLGRFAFELPADQILPTGQEVMAGIEVLANDVIRKYPNGVGEQSN